MSDVTMTREEELWEQLVYEAGEELIEQAAAVSVADAEAELRAAGFDVAEERARAEAFLVWLERGGAALEAAEVRVAQAVPQVAEGGPSAPSRREGRKVRPVVWAAAAAAVAAGAAVAYVATRPGETPVAKPTPSSPPTTPTSTAAPVPAPDVVAAAELRRRAAVALAADRLDECFALLAEARQKDPAGDAAPETQKLWEKAERAREAKPKP
ncbi:MAG: hypothetical protein ACRELB_07545 [Polyangiaceae bacterium]